MAMATKWEVCRFSFAWVCKNNLYKHMRIIKINIRNVAWSKKTGADYPWNDCGLSKTGGTPQGLLRENRKRNSNFPILSYYLWVDKLGNITYFILCHINGVSNTLKTYYFRKRNLRNFCNYMDDHAKYIWILSWPLPERGQLLCQ